MISNKDCSFFFENFVFQLPLIYSLIWTAVEEDFKIPRKSITISDSSGKQQIHVGEIR